MGATEVIVRRARPEDDAILGELMVEAFVGAYARKMPEVVVTEQRKRDLRDVASKRDSAAVLVAEVPGAGIVGTATLFRAGTPGGRAWIPGATELRYVSVVESWRGKGVADRVLEAAAAQAREWNASAICIHVRKGAHGVARFYERLGYRRESAADIDLLPEIFLEAFWLPLKETR